MKSLNMYGPFSLSSREIDSQITRISAGNYALGRLNNNNVFIGHKHHSQIKMTARRF